MVVGDDAIDGKCVACSGSSFGSICITDGMEGKFINDDDFDVIEVR